MKQIRFIEDDHTYWDGDRRIHSVTEIMQAGGIIDTAWYTEEARQRGTQVHKAIHLLTENDLDHSILDPELMPFVEAFNDFQLATGFQKLLSEQTVYSESQDYAGRFDLYGSLNGWKVLIDIKTEHAPPWIGIQIASYAQAMKEMGFRVDKTFGLELKKNGRFRLWQHNDPVSLGKFLTALEGLRNGIG